MTRRRGLLFRPKREERRRGIALFMVLASVAVLAIVMTELTYSTQINSRLSYNSIDNLQAFYVAKAALKLSEVRLKAYAGAKNLLNTTYKDAKGMIPAGTVDKIWSFPIIFPIPVPKGTSMADGDTIRDFFKKSSLPGTFTATIIAESSKMNLNLLLGPGSIPGPSGASGTSGASSSSASPAGPSGSSTQAGGPSGASGASGSSALNFRPVLLGAITNVIEQKKKVDHEFAEVYRNVQAEDIVEAIEYYLLPEKPLSNLPGFKEFKAKLLPFFSITELHLIPGIDDELYNLLEPILTVYSTPGININSMDKRTLMSIIPQLSDTDADDILRARDDPDAGQPWASPEDFWKVVGTTSIASQIESIKKTLTEAGITFIVDEYSFKVSVLANVGQSSRRLEAWVILDPNAGGQTQQQTGQPGSPPPTTGASGASSASGGVAPGGIPGTQDASGKAQASGLSLIYWRML